MAKQGVAWTAANIDKRWIGMNVQAHLQARLQRPVAFLNDADAAGIAEMSRGAGRDRAGTVMVITLGTGIGTALFVDGRLLPNTELGTSRSVARRPSIARRRRSRPTSSSTGWTGPAR